MKNENEIVNYYSKCLSLKATAIQFGIGWQKVRKILINEGIYTSETSKKIQEMYNSGMHLEEISEKMGISKSAVDSYLPYLKTEYNKLNPSKNALLIRKCRSKK